MTTATTTPPRPKPAPPPGKAATTSTSSTSSTSTSTTATFRAVPDGPGEAPPPPPAAAPIPGDQPLHGTEGSDPEAPWGRKRDGTPRAKPGRKSSSSTRSTRSSSTRSTSTRSTRPSSTSRRSSGPDYEGAVTGLLQLPGAVLTMAGMVRPELLADAAALDAYGPAIARALADLAREQPAVAALLEKFMQAGPYGAVIAAAAPLVLQILTNHGLLRPGMLGTVAPEALTAAYAGKSAEAPAR